MVDERGRMKSVESKLACMAPLPQNVRKGHEAHAVRCSAVQVKNR